MDLLVVADRADCFAGMLAVEAQRRGRDPVILGRNDAARLFTIAGCESGNEVTPLVPILLRPPMPQRPDRSADEIFLDSECAATLWAACALTHAPVLNRPTRAGFEAGWSPSGSVTEHRASTEPAPELYARQREAARPPPGDRWAREDGRGRTSHWMQAETGGSPFRARPVLPGELYERVVVLRDDAWRTSTVDLPFDLENRSRILVAELGLGFAVVTWGIGGKSEKVRLARIDPYPRPEQITPVWDDCLSALFGYLQC